MAAGKVGHGTEWRTHRDVEGRKHQGSPTLYIKVNRQGLSMCSLLYAAVFPHHHHNQFLLV